MRHDYIVVVADGTRARFFTLVPATLPEVDSGPRLVEHDDLVNTEHRLHGRDKYSTTRTDSRPNPGGGPPHGFDDHRERQEEQHERRFASEIMAHVMDLAQAHQASHVVLTAEKHMLGLLREARDVPPGIELHEMTKDLVRFSPAELLEHVTTAGLLPGGRPADAR